MSAFRPRCCGLLDEAAQRQSGHVHNIGVANVQTRHNRNAPSDHAGVSQQTARASAMGEHASTRQNDPELGEVARLRIDLNRPAMLLDDDVVADG